MTNKLPAQEILSKEEFEPSNSIALLPLINLVKKLGFPYRTSSYGSGVSVSQRRSYHDPNEPIVVNYYDRNLQRGSFTDTDKLCAVAQALMDKGLGAIVHEDSKGDPAGLSVFAYDNTAALEAYNTAQKAQWREDAKVTREVKAERIGKALDYLAEQIRKAKDTVAQSKATTLQMFEALESALATGDAQRGQEQAKSLESMSMETGTKSLQWAFAHIVGAQKSLKEAEALELKDADLGMSRTCTECGGYAPDGRNCKECA